MPTLMPVAELASLSYVDQLDSLSAASTEVGSWSMVDPASLTPADPLWHEWSAAVNRDPECVVDHHPALWPDPHQGQLWYYRDSQNAMTFAMLAPRPIRLRYLNRLSSRLSLRGMRLVGDRCFGGHSCGELLPELAEKLFETQPDVDALLMEDCPVDAPVRTRLNTLTGRRIYRAIALTNAQPHWVKQLPTSIETCWQSLGRKQRYNLQRERRKLGGRLQVFSKPRDVAEFLQRAEYVSKRSWQTARMGLRIANSPQTNARLESYAQLGALRCYILERDGQPTAFAFGCVWNGRYMLEEIGFDASLAEYSPGKVMMAEIIEDQVQSGTGQRLDFGFGDGEYKRRLAEESYASALMLLVSGRTRARWLSATDELLARGVRGVRWLLRRIGLESIARRRYRRV